MPIIDSVHPPLMLVGSGTTLTTGAEQTIIQLQDTLPFEIWGVIDLNNMQAADTLRVREYIYIGGAWRMHSDSGATISGVPTLPALQTGPVVSMGYWLTIQRTAGADRNYPWEMYKGVK